MKNKIITDVVDKNIQQHISSTTCRITKSTNRHQPFKGRIEIIDEAFDAVLQKKLFVPKIITTSAIKKIPALAWTNEIF